MKRSLKRILVEDTLKSIVELRDVYINYLKVEAVQGVSLAVEQENIIALMGANGAGKSTILKAIIGLKGVGRGEIFFDGENVTGKKAHEMVKGGVALCPEGRRIFTEMSVVKNLITGAYLRKDKKKVRRQLAEIYEYFPILGKRRSQLGGKLSGGEQQMLAIGRALMADPKLLLLDEPSLGLAPILVQEVGTIVKNILGRGVSIILAEQNALWALELTGYGFVLENGKITVDGTYEKLVGNDYIRDAYLGG